MKSYPHVLYIIFLVGHKGDSFVHDLHDFCMTIFYDFAFSVAKATLESQMSVSPLVCPSSIAQNAYCRVSTQSP